MRGVIRVVVAEEKSNKKRWIHISHDDSKKDSGGRVTAHLISILPWRVSVARRPPCPRDLDYMRAYVYDVCDAHVTGAPCGFDLRHEIDADAGGMSEKELWALAVRYIQTRNVTGLCQAVRRMPAIVRLLGSAMTPPDSEEGGDGEGRDTEDEESEEYGEPDEQDDKPDDNDHMVQLLKDGIHGRGNLVHVAVQENYVDALNALLCADPDLIESRDEHGHTPLHKACASVRTDCATALMAWGADINACGGRDDTVSPLIMVALATSQKWIRATEIDKLLGKLCDAGADQWSTLNIAGVALNVPRIVTKLRGARFVRLVLRQGHFQYMAACPAGDGKTVVDDCVNSRCVIKMLIDSGSARKRDIAHVLKSTSSSRVKRLIRSCADADSE